MIVETNSHMPKMKAYTRKYVPLREKSCKMLEKFMVSTWDEVIVLVVSEEALPWVRRCGRLTMYLYHQGRKFWSLDERNHSETRPRDVNDAGDGSRRMMTPVCLVPNYDGSVREERSA